MSSAHCQCIIIIASHRLRHPRPGLPCRHIYSLGIEVQSEDKMAALGLRDIETHQAASQCQVNSGMLQPVSARWTVARCSQSVPGEQWHAAASQCQVDSGTLQPTFTREVLRPLQYWMPVFMVLFTFTSFNGILFTSGHLFSAGTREGHLPHTTSKPKLLSMCSNDPGWRSSAGDDVA
ncbi:hypothetical protein O3P69_019689 [Scylla paramamosain]|uniref:Uncharacterized protein n=1 Tax=Scylla paramamosain TaxID=85552 RepID=A0AAW0SYQ4_SCYPA